MFTGGASHKKISKSGKHDKIHHSRRHHHRKHRGGEGDKFNYVNEHYLLNNPPVPIKFYSQNEYVLYATDTKLKEIPLIGNG